MALVKLEKEFNEKSWYVFENIRFRIKKIESGFIVWILVKNYNICKRLLFYDFIDRLTFDKVTAIIDDNSWNGRLGYKIINEKGYETVIINYILEFLIEFRDIIENTCTFDEYVSDEEWYDLKNNPNCI